MDAVGTQHGRRRLRQLHCLHNKRKGYKSHGRGEKLNDEGHWAKKRSQAKDYSTRPESAIYCYTKAMSIKQDM